MLKLVEVDTRALVLPGVTVWCAEATPNFPDKVSLVAHNRRGAVEVWEALPGETELRLHSSTQFPGWVEEGGRYDDCCPIAARCGLPSQCWVHFAHQINVQQLRPVLSTGDSEAVLRVLVAALETYFGPHGIADVHPAR